MKLTQEEKRIKIAEACGWVRREYGGWGVPNKPADRYGVKNKVWDRVNQLPEYFNDLNACQDAWKKLAKGNEELEDKYSIELLRTVGSEDPADGKRPNGSDATWALASNAPSSARAEAFGLALNLWEAGQ